MVHHHCRSRLLGVDLPIIGQNAADPPRIQETEQLFLVAVNCRRAAATCFCHSMKTGPGVDRPCDLTLTEFEDSFVIRVGSERGGDVLAAAETWARPGMDALRARLLETFPFPAAP